MIRFGIDGVHAIRWRMLRACMTQAMVGSRTEIRYAGPLDSPMTRSQPLVAFLESLGSEEAAFEPPDELPPYQPRTLGEN